MKRIAISKRLWRQLHRLKNQWGLTTIPRTIEYLIDSKGCLLQENLQVIHLLVDELLNVKNLEEKVAKKQSSVLEFQCLQCSSPSFKLDEFICFETGIICPFCGYFYGILVDQKVEKNEIS